MAAAPGAAENRPSAQEVALIKELETHIEESVNAVFSQPDASPTVHAVLKAVAEDLLQRATAVEEAALPLNEALKLLPPPVDAATFAALRQKMRALGGTAALRAELESKGFVEEGKLTTGVKPFNVFARVASGVMTQPGMEKENENLGAAGSRFAVCSNLPANDAQWESADPEWVGKASMAKRHRFLSSKDLSWEWFNVLAFGLDGSVAELSRAIECLEAMQSAAEAFASATDEWSAEPSHLGLFLHSYPHNSVNSLHLHMLDLRFTGPTYENMKYKNLPLSDALAVLRAELDAAK